MNDTSHHRNLERMGYWVRISNLFTTFWFFFFFFLLFLASQTFGFQVISRDSRGIKLKCDHLTLFRNNELVKGLNSGALDPKTIAAESASRTASTNPGTGATVDGGEGDTSNSIETWSVLAINKFDSTRKRMSILLRAPGK